jgi:hypothetical protein
MTYEQPLVSAQLDALVPGSVADHDAAVAGAGRRVVQGVHRLQIGQRPCRRGGHGAAASGRGIRLDDVYSGALLFRVGKELRRQPAEDVVDDRLRVRDLRAALSDSSR